MQRLALQLRILGVYRTPIRSATTAADSVRQAFRSSDAVCFDVDSTVVREEGIDHLAEVLGKGPAVAQLTKKAMEGGMNFRQALAARLDILQPTREQIDKFVKEHPLTLTPKVKELVKALQQNGKQVYLVSGGFRQLINPVAQEIGVPLSNVYANTFVFDHQTDRFDVNEPTSDSGGKGKVIALLKERYKLQRVVMVGDGATDLEARPPASLFVCYGGVVTRQAVKEKADWFVTDFQELLDELDQKGSKN